LLSHTRHSSDAASVHWRHELDNKCRKCCYACIRTKRGHFSI